MAVKFQLRRDTAANWTAANTVLDIGEPGVETDTLKLKIGDGVTPWNSLDYSIIREFSELLNQPTTLAGYGITDAATSAQGALADTALQPGDGLSGAFTGDVTGSVFADDSTVMIDGVAATVNLANNSITDLSDADQTVQTTDDVTFNSIDANIFTSLIDSSDSSAITITPDVVMSAGLTVGNHVVPSSNENIDLGNATNRFRDLYLSGNTLDLGGARLTKVGNAIQLPAGSAIEGVGNISAPDQDLNTTDNVTFANATLTGYLAGPATFTIDPAAVGDNTGLVVIAGDLQVDGTTTTINSTTVEVDDLNIQLATGAINAAAANGAGITVDGASATITYNGTNDEWDFNKTVNVGSNDLQAARLLADSATTPQTIYYVSSVEKGYSRINSEVLEHNGVSGVMLRHNGFEKLTTTTDGISVTGTITGTLATAAQPNITSVGTLTGLTATGATINTSALRLQSLDTSVNDTESIGDIEFYSNDSSGGGTGVQAKISAIAEGAFGNAYGLAFSTGSSANPIQRVRINKDGNVGINTDDPQYQLHVKGAGDIKIEDESGGSAHLRIGASTTGTRDSEFKVKVSGSLDEFHIDHDYTTGGAAGSGTVFKITSDDNVDITNNITSKDYILKAIDKDIADTAVDVFVYDTSKDSDGGAWRFRTQHTSWYNETLNTATRGSRKAFPAVAVIVAEDDKVTIYDADDPDLPMWMIFNAGGANGEAMIGRTNEATTAITILNGVLCVGRNSFGLHIINFVSDKARFKEKGYDTPYLLPIGTNRNSGNSWVTVNEGNDLIDDTIRDVAMKVLPNAPIDAATGLPVPTIAVATAGGVSVIKDDGNVYDMYGGNWAANSRKVTFGENNLLYFTTSSFAWISVDVIGLNQDYTNLEDQRASYKTTLDNYPFKQITGSDYAIYGAVIDGAAYGEDSGTTFATGLVSYNPVPRLTRTHISDLSYGTYIGDEYLYNHVTSDYNTGWMHGDIKLATLSDTDATNVTGSELVTNGKFDTDITGWTAGNGATLSFSSNKLRITNVAGAVGYAYQAITTEIGKTYTVSLSLDNGTSIARFAIATSSVASDIVTTTTEETATFTAVGTTTYVRLINGTSTTGQYSDYDNISVRLAELDRSVNGNGLQVNGTIIKTAVATGADLVAYSQFSSGSIAGNYLQHPFNSNLHNNGTGDFLYSFWINAAASSNETFIDHSGGVNTTDNPRLRIHAFNATSGILRVYISDGSITPLELPSTKAAANSTWNQVTVVREAGIVKVYINGEFDVSAAWAGDMTRTAGQIRIGLDGDGTDPLLGSISLFRYGFTAPTAEQIKKIYEDEKVLFQENAKATLYGTSDEITALAYDDTTKLLHVGTNDGRSVFQGLRRVDNTTTAVGAAISASNGLVAEE